jgi:hypothetical protein
VPSLHSPWSLKQAPGGVAHTTPAHVSVLQRPVSALQPAASHAVSVDVYEHSPEGEQVPAGENVRDVEESAQAGAGGWLQTAP